jgi:hypothetical protein
MRRDSVAVGPNPEVFPDAVAANLDGAGASDVDGVRAD